jgi:hypothetical protein
MNQEIVDAVHKAITPSEMKDMYYPGMENTESVAFASYVENRFQASIPSVQFGSSSTVIFNPSEGLGDILLTLQLPAGTYTNLGCSAGWGYAAIRQLGIRVGNSSLYYFTGDQLLQSVLSECEDSAKRDNMFQLGGQALLPADFADENKRTAYVYIKCPWNSPSAQEKPLPLPTDLLTQPVQFIIEFEPANKIFIAGTSPAALPTQFSSAIVQFRQTHLMNGSDLLARRVDMNSNALSFPLKNFQQTTFRTTVSATAGVPVQVNLTGFRSGSLKSIDLWAVSAADLAAGNPNRWVLLGSVRLLLNGLVYYDAPEASNQFFSIVDRKTGAQAAYGRIAGTGTATLSSVADTMYWLNIPFAQHTESLAGDMVVSTGIPIMNSVVNLEVSFPTTASYVLNASYNYAANLMFSRGGADYVF